MIEAAGNKFSFQMGPEPDSNPDRPRPMEWAEYSRKVTAEWKALLAGNPGERAVQDFLEFHPSMIPGGHGDVGPGGNHRSKMFAVFTRPELKGEGPSYIPDFMWITRSSALVTPILIEIEDPEKPWFTAKGRLTSQFHEAHGQLRDWRTWFETGSNKEVFRRRFLFEDTYASRPMKPYYVLICGRQSHFSSQKHFLVREQVRRADEVFTTFDSLKPLEKQHGSLTVKMTAGGQPHPWAFDAGYETGAFVGEDAIRLGDPAEALARSKMMSAERKEYVATRWEYWRKVELNRDRSRHSYADSMGME
jgi:hypothetical protein